MRLCPFSTETAKNTAFHVIWVSSVTFAVLLKREAGVTHEQLHERFAAYERGEEISLPLTLDSDEAIRKLGFDPKAA